MSNGVESKWCDSIPHPTPKCISPTLWIMWNDLSHSWKPLPCGSGVKPFASMMMLTHLQTARRTCQSTRLPMASEMITLGGQGGGFLWGTRCTTAVVDRRETQMNWCRCKGRVALPGTTLCWSCVIGGDRWRERKIELTKDRECCSRRGKGSKP